MPGSSPREPPSGGALAKIAGWGGGDDEDEEGREEWYSEEALAARSALRGNPLVLAAIRDAWKVVQACSVAAGQVVEGDPNAMSKDAYFTSYRKLYLMQAVVLGDAEVTVHDCAEIAADDWEKDSKGGGTIDEETWSEGWFEWLDMHTDCIDAMEYVNWSKHTIDEITRLERLEPLKPSNGGTRPASRDSNSGKAAGFGKVLAVGNKKQSRATREREAVEEALMEAEEQKLLAAGGVACRRVWRKDADLLRAIAMSPAGKAAGLGVADIAQLASTWSAEVEQVENEIKMRVTTRKPSSMQQQKYNIREESDEDASFRSTSPSFKGAPFQRIQARDSSPKSQQHQRPGDEGASGFDASMPRRRSTFMSTADEPGPNMGRRNTVMLSPINNNEFGSLREHLGSRKSSLAPHSRAPDNLQVLLSGVDDGEVDRTESDNNSFPRRRVSQAGITDAQGRKLHADGTVRIEYSGSGDGGGGDGGISVLNVQHAKAGTFSTSPSTTRPGSGALGSVAGMTGSVGEMDGSFRTTCSTRPTTAAAEAIGEEGEAADAQEDEEPTQEEAAHGESTDEEGGLLVPPPTASQLIPPPSTARPRSPQLQGQAAVERLREIVGEWETLPQPPRTPMTPGWRSQTPRVDVNRAARATAAARDKDYLNGTMREREVWMQAIATRCPSPAPRPPRTAPPGTRTPRRPLTELSVGGWGMRPPAKKQNAWPLPVSMVDTQVLTLERKARLTQWWSDEGSRSSSASATFPVVLGTQALAMDAFARGQHSLRDGYVDGAEKYFRQAASLAPSMPAVQWRLRDVEAIKRRGSMAASQRDTQIMVVGREAMMREALRTA